MVPNKVHYMSMYPLTGRGFLYLMDNMRLNGHNSQDDVKVFALKFLTSIAIRECTETSIWKQVLFSNDRESLNVTTSTICSITAI